MGHQKFDQNYYRHVERFSQFTLISSGSEIRDFGAQFDKQIENISEYLSLLRERFEAE